MPLLLAAATPLAALDLPYLDVVLAEIFHVPPPALFPEAAVPATIADLAAAGHMSVAEVVRRCSELQVLAQGIALTGAELAALAPEGRVLLDVRLTAGMRAAPAGAVVLADTSMAELWPRLQPPVIPVALCETGARSFSAAMYLRQRGLGAARYLVGGLKAL